MHTELYGMPTMQVGGEVGAMHGASVPSIHGTTHAAWHGGWKVLLLLLPKTLPPSRFASSNCQLVPLPCCLPLLPKAGVKPFPMRGVSCEAHGKNGQVCLCT